VNIDNDNLPIPENISQELPLLMTQCMASGNIQECVKGRPCD